jgi:hypothetical protein
MHDHDVNRYLSMHYWMVPFGTDNDDDRGSLLVSAYQLLAARIGKLLRGSRQVGGKVILN